MRAFNNPEQPSEDFETLPSELDIQSKIVDLLLNDEEFNLAMQKINEHGEYIERRLGAIDSEALREKAEEAVLDKMWKLAVPRSQMEGFRTEEFQEVLQSVGQEARKAQSHANVISDSVGAAGRSTAAFAGVALGGVLAASVIATVGAPIIGGAVAGAVGVGLGEAAGDSQLADFLAERRYLNRLIEDLEDSASRMEEAREELDRIIALDENNEDNEPHLG